MRLRTIFMGTPELACASLEALLASPGLEIVAVVTQPDRPKGRDLKLTPSPVKLLAERNHLLLFQPLKARDQQFLASMQQLRPDLIAVAAFGQLLPPLLLELPPHGCINVHTSLLPKYRGAAPIQWAILNGDPQTGVTIMKMDVGLDTGAILSQDSTPIYDQDDAKSLHDRLAQLGARLLVQTIPEYTSGKLQPTPQPASGETYARKIKKEDGRLNWTLPARSLRNQVRGLVPWPGAFTSLPEPRAGTLKIWNATITDAAAPPGEIISADNNGLVVACGHQALQVQMLQREGARRLTAQQFLSGCPLRPGQQLGKNA